MSEFDEYVETYECACARGLALTGENRDYYARARVEQTRRMCAAPRDVLRIIDFGCGLGHTVRYLLEAFPNASVLGIDNSPETIHQAEQSYGNTRVQFALEAGTSKWTDADLIYCNGVFHHIAKADRPSVTARLVRSLRPGGLFALWENNPWNPGTRLVMSRIPFDREAVVLSHLEAAALVRNAGLYVRASSFHFYFPGALKFFRPAERLLTALPLGGQYCVLSQRPNTTAGHAS